GDTEEIGIGSNIASPESCLEREEKSTEIQQAIANLPETLRDTFRLHFYQELTHTEIAQRQGISYDNVCRRIYRARKQLKEKLSGYFLGIDSDDEQLEPVYEAHPRQKGTAVDQKDTGVIAFREDSAQEKKSQEAIASGGGSMVLRHGSEAHAPKEGSVEAICDLRSRRKYFELIHRNFRTNQSPPAKVSIVHRLREGKRHVDDAEICGEKVGKQNGSMVLSSSWLRAIASLVPPLRDTFILHKE
ncbi:MAG: sigma-70 family RNA polymerase sigma factor, partial [Symploca sp. SIO1B1]|nr:sigma-70 family RNA polymerase sigma factor [Symploca sp. SIO1B1]